MEEKSSKLKGKKISILIALLLVVSLGFNIFLVVKLNSMPVAKTEDINQKTGICGKEEIEKYNNGFFGEENQYSELKELKKNIESKTDNEKDVNCVMILYGIANLLKDKQAEIKNYEKLKEHTEKGFNPSLKIINVGNIDYMNPRRGGASAGGSVNAG